MSKKSLGLGWSPENARIIEEWLTALLESIPGVSDVRGCSSDTLRDYKVAFNFEDDQTLIIGAYLKYLPDGRDFLSRPNQPAILAYTSLGEEWPAAVTSGIQNIFPHCVHETRTGMGPTAWHYWSLISVYDLRTHAEKEAAR